MYAPRRHARREAEGGEGGREGGGSSTVDARGGGGGARGKYHSPRDFCVRRTRARLAVAVEGGHPSDAECNHIGIGASVTFKIGDKLHFHVGF